MSLARSIPGRGFVAVSSYCRLFSTTGLAYAPKKQVSQDNSKKKEAKRMALLRLQAKQPANKSPLYMTIPEALRYLRAAEVGFPINEAVISICSVIVNDKGAPPINGSVKLPRPLKETKLAVFSDDSALQEEATKFGASLVGGSELIENIKNGKVQLDFDKAFATPDIVSSLNQIARILGPRGLMPNAKRGTVITDVQKAVVESHGSLPFRQRNNLLSLPVARTNFTDEETLENIIEANAAIKESISRIRTKKPILFGETTITSTHGPGIVIDF
ncbi:hypothetical protein LJB42_002816 [Komagataella kurtzmanii]|nr:hypothetical protein LJB42_002816 [Komagataella kurtzmanii]